MRNAARVAVPRRLAYNGSVSSTAQQIFEQALSLPDDERRDVAERLLDTVVRQTSEEIAKAWDDEAVRRVEAAERGEVQAIDGEEAIALLEAKYGRRHGG